MRNSCLMTLVLLGGLANQSFAYADEPRDEILKQLEMPVLTGEQTLEDVRRFSRSRIPAVPSFETAEAWQKYAESTRKAALENVVFRGTAVEWQKAWTKVERLETMKGGPGYSIQKLRLEVLPDMWVPALLYLPEKREGKVPVFLNVNGHDPNGKAADYKQARCIHLARNGVIALNLEWFGMGQLATGGFSHARMNQLDLCGASGLAPFYLAMSRSIDFLLSLDNADEQRVGVAGLSGGGWQTILISSLDPRVTLCNPVAGYSSFRTRIENYSDLGDSEQTPVDLGITADYAQLTALMAPRAALLTYNEKDNCCFASGHALDPLVQAASPVYKLLGHENRLRTHVNTDPGTHNFLLDNRQALYRMIRDQWYQGNESEFATTELPLEAEIKTREVLDVSLPSNNVDFHSLALSLSESLPHSTPRPDAVSERQTWRKARIKELRSVVKPIDGDVTATEISKVTMDGVTIVRWQLQIGKDWLIPAVEFSKADSKSAALVISDDGRKSAAEHVQRLLSDGHRVIVVDPFYFGECSIEARSYLWALMISTVGERPLGVQAGQIMSVAKWMQKSTGVSEVKLVTHGSRASVAGLIATVLDSKAIAQIEEHSPMESLKTVLQTNLSFDQAPALFCADLLAITDLPQLRELLPAAQQ